MRISIGLTLVMSLSLTGCLSTARIKRDPLKASDRQKLNEKTDVQGIPFYTKMALCKQETTWLQPFYTLTLKRTIRTVFVDEDAANDYAEANKKTKPKLGEPVVTTHIQVLSLSQYQSNDVRDLRGLVTKSGGVTPDEIENKWNTIASWAPYVPLNDSEDTLVASDRAVKVKNSSSPEVMVDYSRVYYYNSPRPWIGSSQIDAKLAPDATLSEGSAQVQSETLSNFIPVGTALSAVASIEAPGAAPAALPGQPPPPFATEKKIQYELSVKEDIYKHTHSRYAGFRVPCLVDPTGVTTDYTLTVSLSEEEQDKKDEENTVKVSGSVTLPKKADDKK